LERASDALRGDALQKEKSPACAGLSSSIGRFFLILVVVVLLVRAPASWVFLGGPCSSSYLPIVSPGGHFAPWSWLAHPSPTVCCYGCGHEGQLIYSKARAIEKNTNEFVRLQYASVAWVAPAPVPVRDS
jgi:hypothetical protein